MLRVARSAPHPATNTIQKAACVNEMHCGCHCPPPVEKPPRQIIWPQLGYKIAFLRMTLTGPASWKLERDGPRETQRRSQVRRKGTILAVNCDTARLPTSRFPLTPGLVPGHVELSMTSRFIKSRIEGSKDLRDRGSRGVPSRSCPPRGSFRTRAYDPKPALVVVLTSHHASDTGRGEGASCE